MKAKHYGAIDGLRTIACIGVLMMHVRANSDYEVPGIIYNKIVPGFTDFVFLFMTISAFGMCCGYYEKVVNNKISFSDFYGKRFKKILPFFGILVFLDLLISPSINALFEVFANLTLLFGFLPNCGGITVIGVGWFLGTVFVFYICFPFFCTLIQNKKRAWLSFAVSVVYAFVCEIYFGVGRQNILFSGCFFIAGGIIYLYREKISQFNQWILIAAVAISIVIYYVFGSNPITCLLVCSLWLSYSIVWRDKPAQGHRFLQNKATKFLGSVSMEIYLSHMVIFRIIEKLKLNHLFQNDVLQYLIVVIAVLFGAVVFAIIVNKGIAFVSNVIVNKVRRA